MNAPATHPFGRALTAAAFATLACVDVSRAQGAQPPTAAATAKASASDPKPKRPLAIDDYTRWRAVESPMLSNDGKWAAWVQRYTNVLQNDSKPELHVRRLDTNQDTVIQFASQPSFSSDSRWVVYFIEIPPPPRQARPAGAPAAPAAPAAPGAPGDSAADTSRARGAPNNQPTRRVELRELATGKTLSWQDIQTATFSPTATHLLLRRRPPTGAGGAGGAAGGGGGPGGPPGGGPGGGGGAASTRGTDALLHTLATARSVFLGSVNDAGFNRRGDLLAFTVEATVKDGNGLYVVDLATGGLQALDNDARTFTRLAWTDDGTGIAVLKGREVPRMRERENVLLAFPSVRAALTGREGATPVKLDSAAAGIPKGYVISDRATLDWSDDNKRVFFGIIPQRQAPDTGRRRSTDSVPDVDVWRTQDERIVSVQMIRLEADRNFTFRQAFDVATGKLVLLSDSSLKDVEVSPDGRWAVGRDARPWVSDYGRPRADLYRVNTTTGERTLMLKGQIVGQHVFGISPDGRHFVYWNDDKFNDYDLDAGTTRVIAPPNAPSFVNAEWDYPGVHPPWGVAGYTADGKGFVAQTRYDLWYLPFAGNAPARNLTSGEGTQNEIQFRRVRTVPPDPMDPRPLRDSRVIDLTKPITLSAYGEWTKKNGFYELNGSSLKPIAYEDALFSTPVRALKADRFVFTRQTFVEFPDLRVSGPAFGQSSKISDANPQQAEFTWGRRVLFDFTLKDGKRSQGILALPDDYQPGEKRPMIVTFYEKNSQNMHRYSPPTFITGMGSLPMEAVSRGYITMLPDVYFRTGQSHSDMLEAVEQATKKVIEMGYADPKRIGVHGHSYGGEGAAFIATQSRFFAAVGVGAGVTDLYSDFAQSWGWSYQVNAGSGDNAFEYYLNSQGRWGFSPWDKPEVYHFESALTHAPAVAMPVLIMHGTADPTVSFQEGMNFYQALRYNKKEAYMLAYPGEGHGLRGLANRRDLTIRYFQFFDHYLKGAPAPKWMTDGVPYLVKDLSKEPK